MFISRPIGKIMDTQSGFWNSAELFLRQSLEDLLPYVVKQIHNPDSRIPELWNCCISGGLASTC